LIPSAVALLAHKRLRDVADALERKAGGGVYDAFYVGTDTVTVRDTERRVLGLAKAAAAMFEAGPSIDPAPGAPVGRNFGRFALAGSTALDLAEYAEMFLPGGGWLRNTIARGTPDPNLSRVVVGSSQLAVRTGEIAIGLTNDDAEQARIQAFAMGMTSAVASAVIVNPVLRGLQARRTKLDWSHDTVNVDIGAAEQRIVKNLLGGPSGVAAWQGWFPGAGDLPPALFDGFERALEEAYAISSARPHGFGDFEAGLTESPLTPVTAADLRAGFSLARLDAHLTSWGAGAWYVALLPMLVVPVAGFALVLALPHGKAFLDPSLHVDERSVWEVLTLATGLGALAPAGYSIFLWTQVHGHTEEFVETVAMLGLRVALSVAAIFAGDASAGVRWGLLFTPLALIDVYALVRGLIEKSRHNPTSFVFLLQTLPVITGATVLLFALIADGLVSAHVDEGVAYAVTLAAMAALVLAALGIPLAVALSNAGRVSALAGSQTPALLDSVAQLAADTSPAGLAALFDDSTLWADPAVAGLTLADLRYPAGRRALLRLWWTGNDHIQISHDEHTVTFMQSDGSTKDVALPPGKTSTQDLAGLLTAQMPGLQAEPFDPDDPRYDLPYPHTLSDPGDTQATLPAHDAHEHDFFAVGETHETAYILRHTPRVELVTTYGESGPATVQLAALDIVPGGMLGNLDQSALGLAADLAVLLCMGAAPSLAGSAAGSGAAAPAEVRGPILAFDPPGSPARSVGPVFQVFRQWNLDERRANEWRLLVHGGAASDQPDPAHADPGMRPNPAPGAPGYASAAQSAPPAPPAPAPDQVARALGWVPLWRAWSRMAADVTADTSSASPMSYTPTVTLGDSTELQPSNADLTNAIRYLLDLP
jgi:hypothetical protein